MRKILACTLFLSILLGCATATAQSRKERRAKRKAKTEKQASKSTHTPVSVKPEKTVTEKTTVQQTEPYCPELNRNLTPAQIDSLVALWREKQTLQSYDTFFNDYIDIDSLASSSDTTPDSVYANRLRALVSPVQLPFNPIVKKLHPPLRRYPLRDNQPGVEPLTLLFPADRGRAHQGRPARRAACPADHRIGSLDHGHLSDGCCRTVAIHARDRQKLRTGDQFVRR